ncbi:MAG: hypothetical protein GY720_07935, partial [bacterium]|nr:hypothetical protein [bacterium]
LALAISTICCFGLTGCDDGSPTEGIRDGSGVAQMPLSTWSNAGNRYRLVGTFDITGPETTSTSTTGDEPELSVDLTIGDYTILLTSGWQLYEVAEDGSAALASSAVITSDNPQSFTITNQTITPILFTFAVGDDVVAFGEGRGQIETEVEEEDRPVSLAAGFYHHCALLESGAVRCWGRNDYGQLGYGHVDHIGDNELPSSAGDVSLGGRAVALTAGGDHTCAILDTGNVRCWGRGSYGQLGHGNTDHIGDSELPSDAGDVPLGAPAVAISAGFGSTCAILDYGAVRCWGYNSYGQLGYGNTIRIGDDEPASDAGDVPLGEPAIAIDSTRYFTCAVLESGAVRCWGENSFGALGYGHLHNIGDDETPDMVGNVELGARAVDIAAGGYHACAILETGNVRCWGRGSYGQLGSANTTTIGDDELPSSVGDVSLGEPAAAIRAGYYHSCAILESGVTRCWGYNAQGQLGLGLTTYIGDDETPVSVDPIPVGTSVISIATSAYSTCIATQSDVVRCFGRNNYGQLGLGHTNDIGDDEAILTAGPVSYR